MLNKEKFKSEILSFPFLGLFTLILIILKLTGYIICGGYLLFGILLVYFLK